MISGLHGNPELWFLRPSAQVRHITSTANLCNPLVPCKESRTSRPATSQVNKNLHQYAMFQHRNFHLAWALIPGMPGPTVLNKCPSALAHLHSDDRTLRPHPGRRWPSDGVDRDEDEPVYGSKGLKGLAWDERWYDAGVVAWIHLPRHGLLWQWCLRFAD